MSCRQKPFQLAHYALSSIMALQNFSQNNYLFPPFPSSLWERIHSLDWMRDSLIETCDRTPLGYQWTWTKTYLPEKLDETHRDVATSNEVHQPWFKAQYDKSIKPKVFSKGDLVLVHPLGRKICLNVARTIHLEACLRERSLWSYQLLTESIGRDHKWALFEEVLCLGGNSKVMSLYMLYYSFFLLFF